MSESGPDLVGYCREARHPGLAHLPDKNNNKQAGHLIYTFGEFSLDTTRGVLCRSDEVVPLRPKSFAVLLYFLQHPGELVSRQDLIESVWKNAAVSDDSITQCIVEVRRALDDADHTMIRTVPRRGFVFESPVEELLEEAAGPAPSSAENSKAMPWQWIAAAAFLAGLAVVLWMGTRDDEEPGNSAPDVKASIAVLAFADMTADGDRQYFSDGIAEEILNHLAQIPELRVISRSSSFRFRDHPDIPVIAERLGVDFVLEGSVRGAGDNLRITAQLISADTNAHVWSEAYDRQTSLENLITVQNDIALSVTAAIGVSTGTLLSSPPQEDPEIDGDAMENYLRGVFHLRKIQTAGGEQEDFEVAIERLQAAIDIEPTWALPHAALGTTLHFHATNPFVGVDQKPATFEASRASLLEAIRLDPEYGPAYGSLAFVTHSHDLDFDQAEALYAKAATLGHRRHWGQALMMLAQGRFEEGIAHYQQALLDDPLSTGITWQLADALRCVGRYEESAAYFDRLLEMSPENDILWEFRALLKLRMGDEATAMQILDERGVDEWPVLFGSTRALLGMREEAEAALDDIEAHTYWNPRPHTFISVVIGDYDRAIDYLERIAEDSPAFLGGSQCPDDIGPLADDPRYRALFADAGIPVNVGN